jgi:hypothetical protein
MKVFFYTKAEDGALFLGGVTAAVPVTQLDILVKCKSESCASQFMAHLQERFREIAS